MIPAFTESVVEQAALAWLESAGWQVRNGAELRLGRTPTLRCCDAAQPARPLSAPRANARRRLDQGSQDGLTSQEMQGRL